MGRHPEGVRQRKHVLPAVRGVAGGGRVRDGSRTRAPVLRPEGRHQLGMRIAAANVPSSKLDETLNVAVWNIREFGKKPRLPESIHYIAEILGQFDLIALVELRDDLSDLGKVLPILGPSWDTPRPSPLRCFSSGGEVWVVPPFL
jgi:hypothetical protein